ncbi:MFS transporter [Pendulispora rubella]|uniref:MFS transporter n=1 Tax=Pendulispora rubella TaxID=2741070 RepID=A0ABZ2LEW2_9BACT
MTEAPSPSRAQSATTWFVLHSTAFLNAAGMGLAIPVLPFLAAHYALGPARVASIVGWLETSYALCAFLAAPVLGALSDAVGRRPVLLVSIVGSAVGYALFGFAWALPLLFASRIVDGLTAGNTSALLAYVGDRTSEEERGRAFGRMGAVAGAGFIVGPALGGLAVRFGGLKAPFFCAAAATALNALLGFFFLPESLPKERRKRSMPTWNPFGQLATLFAWRHVRPFLIVRVLFMAAFACVMTFPLLAKDGLGWGADKVSFVLICVGLADILVQGLLLGFLERVLGPTRVLALGLGLTMLGFGGFVAVARTTSASSALSVASGAFFLAAVVALACGEGLFTATLTAFLSRAAGSDAQGQIQGGNHALQELTAVAMPLAATQLYAHCGPSAPYLAALLLTMASALFLFRCGVRDPEASSGHALDGSPR